MPVTWSRYSVVDFSVAVNLMCGCLLDVCSCVWTWSLSAESDPGVSPQACAGGDEEEEEEESEEGGGSTAAHLLEALRQFRLHHRGQYRAVLEESLAAYRLHGESAVEVEVAEESQRTGDDDDQEEQPTSPPSPPSPLSLPTTVEPKASPDAPASGSDISSD